MGLPTPTPPSVTRSPDLCKANEIYSGGGSRDDEGSILEQSQGCEEAEQ